MLQLHRLLKPGFDRLFRLNLNENWDKIEREIVLQEKTLQQTSDDLIDRVNNLIINATGDSNPEVVDSRLSDLGIGMNFDVLKKRLDFFDNEFKSRGMSVKWFGAKGDYKDYTKEIQKTVDELGVMGGGVCFIPAGHYLINVSSNGGIKMRDNVTLIMDPNATLEAIPCADNWYRILNVYNKKNVKIMGGKLIGERYKHLATTGQMGFGVEVNGSENVIIQNVRAEQFWGDGFIIAESDELGESQNVSILNCIAKDNRRQGLSITGLKGGVVFNNQFFDTNGHIDTTPVDPAAGIDIEPNAGKTCKDILVIGNRCFNNKRGILVYNEFKGATLENIHVVQNHTFGNADVGIKVLGCDGGSIANNTSYKNAASGIVVEKCDNVPQSNNISKYNGNSGIFVNSTHGSLTQGNVCKHNSQNGLLYVNVHNNIANSNVLSENGGNGLRLASSSSNNVTNNMLLGNTLEHVYITDFSSFNDIRHNRFRKVIRSGIVRQMVSDTVIKLDKNAEFDFYFECLFEIFAGPGSGQSRKIIAFNQETKEFTLSSPIVGMKSGSSRYNISPATKYETAVAITDNTCSKNRVKDNVLADDYISPITDLGWNSDTYPNAGIFYPEEEWVFATLQNGWYHGNDNDPGVSYKKDKKLGANTVYLRGSAKDGLVIEGTTIFVLPNGFKPSKNIYFISSCSGDKGFVEIKIDTSGAVKINSTGVTKGYIRFPELSFEI
ncbi:right-handed parallel beta-helix repeat-containing protein [Bacillus fungorum]|uniref:right-handed parallel beta-helix repeat-containing protein n=1 Tax=Bacillus fungorum TaxID=2039284 RepID=UPI003F580187